uniref:Uncharacterized protein n=1 Tax=Onchocerca volvulus TaxID=6282 RepID=A0A8R1TR06_ONCVO
MWKVLEIGKSKLIGGATENTSQARSTQEKVADISALTMELKEGTDKWYPSESVPLLQSSTIGGVSHIELLVKDTCIFQLIPLNRNSSLIS